MIKNKISSRILIAIVLYMIVFAYTFYHTEIKTAFFFSSSYLLVHFILYKIISVIERNRLGFYSKEGVLRQSFKQLIDDDILDVGFTVKSFQNSNWLTGVYRGYRFDIRYGSNIGFGGYSFIAYYQPVSQRRIKQLVEKHYRLFS